MARKKAAEEAGGDNAASQSQPSEAETATQPDRHKNVVVSFRPPAALRASLQALADGERRSVAQIVQFLLEEALEARARKKGRKADAGEEGGA